MPGISENFKTSLISLYNFKIKENAWSTHQKFIFK